MTASAQPAAHGPAPRLLAVGQGVYYLVTGLWPLLSIRTFMAVTGPKRDLWLVRTVGALISVSGSVMLYSGTRRRVPRETALLAAGSAATLTAIDVWYSLRGVISKVYLLDALPELALISGWWLLWRRQPRAGQP